MSAFTLCLRCCVLFAVMASFPVEGATRHWDGGGVSRFWTTAANWSNNVAPVPGDALVFPFSSTGTTSITNNFAAGTDFASLTLENFYILHGNPVDLTNGVEARTGHVALDVRQLNACRVTALSQNLTLSGDYDLNGFPVFLHATGGILMSGTIRGSGSGSQLLKEGAGTLELSGTNTYQGGTTVSEGELIVSGVVPGDVSFRNGSELSGQGTILGSVTTAGSVFISPGGNSRAALTVGGRLELSSGTILVLGFEGPTPGAGHDSLRCSNSVNLGSAQLSWTISAPLVLRAGEVAVILTNTSASPILGEFFGHPEGSRFQLGETEVEISYRGGNGNDVTLTGIAVSRGWAGSALVNLGSNWTTAQNWSSSLLPVPEDGLYFRPGALDRTNFYDFTNGFPFHHVTFGQSNYVIRGTNELVVRHRFEATNQGGAVDFHPALRASLNPTILSNHPGGTLNLHGPVRLTGAVGVFAPRGLITVHGPISASQNTFQRGPGTLQLAGTNQFGASLQIEEGSVTVLNNSALLPASSPVTVLAGARLELAGGRSAGNALTLRGMLSATGDGASNVWSGSIAIPAPATLHASSNCLLRIGDFHGNGSLAKTGSGRLLLAAPGCVNYAGVFSVNEGTVTVPGCVSGGIFLVRNDSTLEGTGSLGGLTGQAGIVSPGSGQAPGRLTVLGPLELNAGTVLRLRLNGLTAASQHSQLTTFNSATALNNPALDVVLGFAPASNATFVVIDKSSGAVTGTFAGLPQNSVFTNHGAVFRISYTGGTGNDVALTYLGATGPTGLRIHDGPSTRRVAIRWNAPTLGQAVAEYLVYRNGFEFKRGAPGDFGSLLLAEDLHLLAGHTYTYQVVAVFADGTHSAPSNELTVTALPSEPVYGTNRIVTVLLRFADFIEEPFPTSQVDALMFTATNSVRAYLEEVSYGRLTIEGSTHGWFTLPRPASNYCATLFPNGLWYSCNNMLTDIYSVLPPAVSNLVQAADRVQYAIHGMGTVGEAGGQVAFYSATNGFGPGTIIHELGHTFGFLHASTLISCLGYPLGPDLVHMRTNNCFTLLYGDRYDPMGGGATVHYNAFFKELAGWLPTNNVGWITADGDYTLHAVERPASNAVQMLKIDLGGEMFWFLEYRTRTGFDGPASPEPPPGGPIDGVLMHVRVSRHILADWDTFWIQPVARTNTAWLDPFSGLCVNVLAQDGTNATVRVTGLNYGFHFTDAQRLGNDARLTWNAVPGARYLLQGSPDFNSWTTLATSVDATNRTMTFTLPGAAAGPFRFFRAAVDTGP